MDDITRGLIDFGNNLPLVRSCQIIQLDDFAPETLETALETLALDVKGVGLIATDHPRCRTAIERLCEAGVRVVTIASDVLASQKSSYVGVDNYAAGRTAAQCMDMITADRSGSVAVFLGSHDFHGHTERQRGFRSYMDAKRPDLTLLPVVEIGEQRAKAKAAMASLLENDAALNGVYCIGAGRKGIVEATHNIEAASRPKIVMHDLTNDTRRWLRQEQIDVVIDQNAKLIAEQAVVRLLGAIAAPTSILSIKNIEARIILRENL